MARRETAARRYAEAAFEVALRDDTVETWRADLETAAEVASDPRVGHMLANPATSLETRLEMTEKILGKAVARPVLNLIGLMIRRGRIDELPKVAAEFRRLDNTLAMQVPIAEFPTLPGATRKLMLDVPSGLAPGDYVVLALIDFGGAELVAGQIDYQAK